MIVCILLPMMIAYAYFYYGLRQENALNMHTHTVTFTPTGILVTLLTPEAQTEEDNNETTPTDLPEMQVKARYQYPADSLQPPRITASGFYLPLNQSHGHLYIPLTAFADPNEVGIALRLLHSLQKSTIAPIS